MSKYNIRETQEHPAAYRDTINPAVLDELHNKILNKLLIEKKFLDKNYSAKQLASDLGTNTRYISAVVSVKFHMNYASLVNKYRIDEAMSILVDKRYRDLTMEDVADMVGFANRQSFYSAFFKQRNCTPRDYKMNYFELHPELMADNKKKQSRRKK